MGTKLFVEVAAHRGCWVLDKLLSLLIVELTTTEEIFTPLSKAGYDGESTWTQ
jgi:hypothetical protein